MQVIREYAFESLRRNKYTSAAILVALFLMTTLMSCFCGMVYTMWADDVFLNQWYDGNWHGELFDNSYGRDLEKIENYASVSAVMIKGSWEVAKISDSGRRRYIIQRPATQEYWDSMPEKHSILEGRLPEKDSELVLSKQYFEDHPDVNVGDTLTLPVGERIYNGEVCMETDTWREGETFRPTGTKTYTLVGIMDVTTSSAVPAYTGMSYMSRESIAPEDSITVYLRFDPMRGTYRELPALAESIGYKKDEYGNYLLRYNSRLLADYMILPPDQSFSLEMLAVPLMILVLALLIVGVFVLIIHNAFALSLNEKMAQFGTLSCVGASPGQILTAAVSEALILVIPVLPFGLAAGWFVNIQLFANINAHNDIGRAAPDIIPVFGLPAVLPALLLSLLTACLSARIPAKKLAKALPIEIIKQEEGLRSSGKKKERKHKGEAMSISRSRRFFCRLKATVPKPSRTSSASPFGGIIGELSALSLAQRKRSYRTAVISLCLSFLLLTTFLYGFSINDASSTMLRDQSMQEEHIQLSVSDGREPDPEFLEALVEVPDLGQAAVYNTLTCAVWVSAKDASPDIQERFGGFDGVVSRNKYSLIERDGRYRMQTELIGLEAHCFREYCERLGIDPEPYFEDPGQALIYNFARDPDASTRRHPVDCGLLDLKQGQTLEFTEHAYDEDTGDYTFSLRAGDLVDALPCTGLYDKSHFTLTAVMPMRHVLDLSTHCSERRHNSTQNLNGRFQVSSEGGLSDSRIEKVSRQMKEIVSYYYGSGDYVFTDVIDYKKMTADMKESWNLIIAFLTAFLAVIGLSNVWAAISGNLRQRSREFAMLKSVGLSSRQLKSLLFLEGVTLGLKPLLLSLPFQIVFVAVFLRLSEVTLLEYLPFAPLGIILGYTALILLAVLGAYLVGGRRIRKENIITAIKNDTL